MTTPDPAEEQRLITTYGDVRELSAPPAPSESRNYPTRRPLGETGDKRFTVGLLIDVQRALISHGFPEFTGLDIVELQQALFRFIYGDPKEVRR